MNPVNSEEFLQGFFSQGKVLTSITTEMPCPKTTEVKLLPNKIFINYYLKFIFRQLKKSGTFIHHSHRE